MHKANRSLLCVSLRVGCQVFEEEEDPAQKSFFSEIIASISDVKFTTDGRYIVSRDYLTVKIWDMNMEAKPVKTIQVRHISCTTVSCGA